MRIDSTSLRGPSKSIFNGPSPIETIDDGVFGNAYFPGPLRDGLSFFPKRQAVIAARVVVLCLSVSPTAVFGRVIAICVNAIKGMAFGSIAHVSKEILKAMKPTFANLDASPAIVAVCIASFGIAAASHGDPSQVCGAVNHIVGGNGIDVQASTTARNALSEIGRVDHDDITAIATTKPTHVTTQVWSALHNCPSCESLTR